MAGITVANMRKGIFLHKLVLIELVIGGWQSFNLFWVKPTYGWWLSTAAVGLHMSTQLHSVIAWIKLRHFMSKRASRIFIGTVILVQPYWILEIYATFAYYNDINETLFLKVRPVEALFRDPWWVASCAKLLWVLKGHYDMTIREVVTISPRFGVMLVAMFLSIAFVILDILSVTEALGDALPVGVNPFWKLALVFKCLTDTVVLDDFKTVLDKLWAFRRVSLGSSSGGPGGEARPYIRQPSESSYRPRARKQSNAAENGGHVSFQASPGQDLELAHFEVQPKASARENVGADTRSSDA